MKVEIRKLTNKSRGFYAIMGPFLARREITKELGGMTWDDDGAVWFVAMRGKDVIGFCALRQRGARAELRSSYVLPEHRRNGVYERLFEERLAAIERPARARSVVHKEAVPVFRAHGFREVKRTKNFHTMEKELT